MSSLEAAKPLTVTVRRAGELLDVSRATIYRAIAAGNLETIHIGGRVLVIYASLEAVARNGIGALPENPSRSDLTAA